MASFTFPKSLRLLNSGDFTSVFNDAPFRASHKHLLILSRPTGLANARLGLIIAKKHVRRAVDRNRIKRVIRESFRQRQHMLTDIDAIVLARPGLDRLSSEDLAAVLDKQWRRIEKKARDSQQVKPTNTAERKHAKSHAD